MKKIYYLFTSALILFTACTMQEQDIFSDSPNVRLNDAIKNDKAAILNSEKGWIMDYFSDKKSEGFTLILKFEAPDKVTAVCKHYLTGFKYGVSKSTFDVIGDDGPILTFDSYNDVIHMFSDPKISPSYPVGVGLNGDYEFRFKSLNPDTIELEGKKRGVKILLRRYTEDITWEEYLNKINGLDSFMFSAAGPSLSMNVDNSTYILKNGNIHVFEIASKSGDMLPVFAPFIVNREGIRFSKPITLNNKTFESFRLNNEGTALVSIENPEIKIEGPVLGDFFVDSRVLWNINKNSMSSDFVEKFGKTENALKKQYAAGSVTMGLKSRGEIMSLYIALILKDKDKTKLEAEIYLDSNLSNANTLSLDCKGNTDGENGKVFYNEVEDLRNLLSYLSGNIQISTPNTFNPTSIKMNYTDRSATDSWIDVTFK